MRGAFAAAAAACLAAALLPWPAEATSFNLTWGELREAFGPGRESNPGELVPPCGQWRSSRPYEPSLCITHGNCTRESCHLLFELDKAVTDRPTTVSPPLYSERPSQSAVWGWGVLSVAIISLSGIVGGLLWPLLKSQYYSAVMRFLIGLGAGSLTATSILQLIPESLSLTGSEGHLDAGLIMLTSIWLLYFGETACKIYFSNDGPDASVSPQPGPPKKI
ncbi:hypothetical protein ONE63_004251 [Megalurothrips usitatus]|uniref:Uncharacterized protein n=1 Tax=Megalurothrips usitatus TaxID=439358 RepID=A0AAV7X6A7_9NEOP|nr:hypothetical protein ONE63_004251 [Megalurothrips usitatus]